MALADATSGGHIGACAMLAPTHAATTIIGLNVARKTFMIFPFREVSEELASHVEISKGHAVSTGRSVPCFGILLRATLRPEPSTRWTRRWFGARGRFVVAGGDSAGKQRRRACSREIASFQRWHRRCTIPFVAFPEIFKKWNGRCLR